MIAEIILAILCIVAGCFSAFFALMAFASGSMGDPDADRPFLIGVLLTIAFIGAGIAILVF